MSRALATLLLVTATLSTNSTTASALPSAQCFSYAEMQTRAAQDEMSPIVKALSFGPYARGGIAIFARDALANEPKWSLMVFSLSNVCKTSVFGSAIMESVAFLDPSQSIEFTPAQTTVPQQASCDTRANMLGKISARGLHQTLFGVQHDGDALVVFEGESGMAMANWNPGAENPKREMCIFASGPIRIVHIPYVQPRAP